jgi:hypothetical protein
VLSFLKQHKVFYGIIGALLAGAFLFNLFGAGQSKDWFDGFEDYSEQFALTTVNCSDDGAYKGNLIIPPAYLSGQKAGNPVHNQKGCIVYASQFGLQGFIYSVIPKVTQSKGLQGVILSLTKVVLALSLAAVLIAFLVFVHRQFGKGPAGVTAGLIVVSDWVVGYAANLYWVIFLAFLPFICSLYVYPRWRNSVRHLWYFYGALAGLFLVRFLTGYEFFSVIAVSAAVPIVYWELQRSYDWKLIAKRSLLVGASAAVAFGLAMAVHIGSLMNDYGSFKEVTHAMEERAEKRSDPGVSFRSVILNFYKTTPEVYGAIDKNIADLDHYVTGKSNPVVYFGLIIVNYAMLPVVTIPVELKGLVPHILQSFIFWAAGASALLWWLFKRRVIKKPAARALAGALVVGLAGICTWPVVAMGHFFEHAHINAIIFYLPFLLWAYVIVGIAATTYWKKLWRRIAK